MSSNADPNGEMTNAQLRQELMARPGDHQDDGYLFGRAFTEAKLQRNRRRAAALGITIEQAAAQANAEEGVIGGRRKRRKSRKSRKGGKRRKTKRRRRY